MNTNRNIHLYRDQDLNRLAATIVYSYDLANNCVKVGSIVASTKERNPTKKKGIELATSVMNAIPCFFTPEEILIPADLDCLHGDTSYLAKLVKIDTIRKTVLEERLATLMFNDIYYSRFSF